MESGLVDVQDLEHTIAFRVAWVDDNGKQQVRATGRIRAMARILG